MGVFNGFHGFDCNEKIWMGLFRAHLRGFSQDLMALLSMDMSDGEFTRKKKGQRPWNSEVDPFLAYSESPKDYKAKWLDKLTPFTDMLTVFREFIASLPPEAANQEEAHFLPTANKVADYLEKVLAHCNGSTVGNNIWIAAGLYVLIAFFLQKDKAELRFYCPPPEYNPVGTESTTIIIPNTEMHSPEAADVTAQAQAPEEPAEVQIPKNVSKEDTHEAQDSPQEAEGEMRSSCRLCGEEEQFFYDDRMGSWQDTAVSFQVLCHLLGGIFGAGFLCMIGINALTVFVPSFGEWANTFLEQAIPRFYSGFAGADAFFLSMFLLCMGGMLAAVLFAHSVDRRVRFIILQEQEKGYRWIRGKCKVCGTAYHEKLRLDQISEPSDTTALLMFQDRPLVSRNAIVLLGVMILSACFVGPLLFAEAQSAYGLRLFLLLLLPLYLCRVIINNRLLRYSVRDYPSLFSTPRDDLFDEDPDEDEA